MCVRVLKTFLFVSMSTLLWRLCFAFVNFWTFWSNQGNTHYNIWKRICRLICKKVVSLGFSGFCLIRFLFHFFLTAILGKAIVTIDWINQREMILILKTPLRHVSAKRINKISVYLRNCLWLHTWRLLLDNRARKGQERPWYIYTAWLELGV